MRRRRDHLRRHTDAGVSLAELLVTMVVMSVIVAATATLVIGSQRMNAQSMTRLDQVQQARVAVEGMSRNLRTAVMPSQLFTSCAGCAEEAFVRGTDFEVQFYANVDNPGNTVGPSRVTYRVEPTGGGVGNLVQHVQIPDSPVPGAGGYSYCDSRPEVNPAPACLGRVREGVLARGVVTDGGALLRYYDGNGTRMVPGGTGLTGDQLRSVLSIELQVTVTDDRQNGTRPTTYVQRLLLPNAQAIIRQGEES